MSGESEHPAPRLDRVVLQLSSGNPSNIALHAAFIIAKAFEGKVDSLLVQDHQLKALAALPFAREVSSLGLRSRPLSLASVEKELEITSCAARRRIEAMARSMKVPVDFEVVHETAAHIADVLIARSSASGVIALGEALSGAQSGLLHRLMSDLCAAAGVLLIGPQAQRVGSPIVAALDSEADIRPLVSAARRIVAANDGRRLVLLAGSRMGGREREIEDEARRHLGTGIGLTLEHQPGLPGQPAIAAEAIRRSRAGLVLARFGGEVVPTETSLGPLMRALDCPLLLLK